MKILFFDYWLKGIANFERLVPELHRQGCTDLKMVHVGSWKAPQDKAVHEHKGFKSYDISCYRTYSLLSVLRREKPDVLLILNLYFLMDKALVVFCRKLGIRVVYLEHGRTVSTDRQSATLQVKEDLRKNFFSKIRVDTAAMLYNYWLSTVISGKPLRFFKSLYALVKDPASMTIYTSYTDELAVDKMLLFSEDDKTEFVCRSQFPDHNMTVVGSPELDGYVQSTLMDRQSFLKTIGVATSDYLLYLEGGFVQARIMSKDDWYAMLSVLADICRRHRLTLVAKLHPRTDQDEHQAFFDKEGIVALKQVDFRNIVEHSYAVTSLMSTTITMPLVSGKRVISPRWGSFVDTDKLYQDDVIRYVYSPSEFEQVLVSGEPTCLSEEHLKDSIGRADGHVIERIVSEILG